MPKAAIRMGKFKLMAVRGMAVRGGLTLALAPHNLRFPITVTHPSSQWCFSVSGINGSSTTGPIPAPNASVAKHSDPAFAVGDGLVLYGDGMAIVVAMVMEWP